jgi:lipoprotein-anchoring transpeptidase ErfK/SrfK
LASRYFDWTNGCVALSDADVEFLAARVKAGTPVLIHP